MLDLDRLAVHLSARVEEQNLSIRGAAKEIGCSPATLGRLLQGSQSPNIPDSKTIQSVVKWLGRNISDFEKGEQKQTTTVADVEVHLRALPGLSEADAEGIVAMVKAIYEFKVREKKKPEG